MVAIKGLGAWDCHAASCLELGHHPPVAIVLQERVGEGRHGIWDRRNGRSCRKSSELWQVPGISKHNFENKVESQVRKYLAQELEGCDTNEGQGPEHEGDTLALDDCKLQYPSSADCKFCKA